MTNVTAIRASLEPAPSANPRLSAGPRVSPARVQRYAQPYEHANLSPIVKSGSLRRQHGHVRLAALRQLARNGAIRVPPIDTNRRQSSLPREILDRSLPPVPHTQTVVVAKPPDGFAVKRKSVPSRGALPATPTTPSWVKQPLNSPWRAPSSPTTPKTFVNYDMPVITPASPTPSASGQAHPGANPLISHRTAPLVVVKPPRPVNAPGLADKVMEHEEETARTRLIPGVRVKEAVEKIENTKSTQMTADFGTPVKAIGTVVERPCAISSAGLSAETRRMMAEARFRRSRKF